MHLNRRRFNQLLFTLPAAMLLRRTGRAEEVPPPSLSPSIVDTHAHIFERSLKLAPVHRYVPEYDAPLAGYLRQLDGHGIARGVLIQPSFLGTDNSYLLAALQSEPQRLRGVIVTEPTASAAELAQFAAAGVVGVRLNLIGAKIPDLTQEPWPGFLRQLVALKLFVQVHLNARDLPRVIDPLLTSGLNIVVDHFGRPDPKLGVDDLGFRYLLSVASSRQVWLKLSGSYRNGADGVGAAIATAAAPMARRAFGPDRLLWGSDWPHTQFERVADYAATLREFETWITDPDERRTILQTTPNALYRF